MSLTSAFIPLGTLFISRIIINSLVKPNHTDLETTLIFLTLTGAFLYFLLQLFSEVSRIVSNLIIRVVQKHIAHSILRKASELDAQFVESKDYYQKLDNARRIMDRKWDTLLVAPINLFTNLISLITVFGFLASFNPWLVLFVLIGIIPNIVVQIKSSNEIYAFDSKEVPENRCISYMEKVLSEPGYAKEVRLYGLTDYLLANARQLFDCQQKKLKKVLYKQLNRSTLCSFVSFGEILFNGINIKNFMSKELYQTFGVVFQDFACKLLYSIMEWK